MKLPRIGDIIIFTTEFNDRGATKLADYPGLLYRLDSEVVPPTAGIYVFHDLGLQQKRLSYYSKKQRADCWRLKDDEG